MNHVTFVIYEKDFWAQRIVFRHMEVVFSAYWAGAVMKWAGAVISWAGAVKAGRIQKVKS